jgi:hypothetical protein
MQSISLQVKLEQWCSFTNNPSTKVIEREQKNNEIPTEFSERRTR